MGIMVIMNNNIINLINEFYIAKQSEIAFIFLGGSACLPYINNPHDLDIYIVYKNLGQGVDRHFKRNENKELEKELKKIDERAAVISQYVDVFNFWKTGICNSQRYKSDFPTYAYQTPNYEIIFGEDTINIKKMNILNDKNRVKNSLKSYMPTITYFYNEKGAVPKSLYHILTELYMLENDSYELTQEQIININIVHDQENTARILELYNWALDEVAKL